MEERGRLNEWMRFSSSLHEQRCSVVVPLAAILVGIQDTYAAVMLDGAKVIVDKVIAPAVQLVGCLWRPIGELAERSIERVRSGKLVERRRRYERGFTASWFSTL